MAAPGRAALHQAADLDAGWSRFGFWSVPVIALIGVWLVQVFSSGGYLPRQWLLAGAAVAALALALFALDAFPGAPSKIAMLTAGLLGAYGVWMGASITWAASAGNAWEATGRALLYALVFATAISTLRTPAARLWLRYAFAAAVLLLVTACMWRLSGSHMAELFFENRFGYPVRYPNDAAALFLVVFWPTLWIAADPRERWFLRGPALGLAAGLLMLALLTQSRGAFWAFAISVVAIFILSPARLRTLVFLAVPLGLTVAAYPALSRYWVEGAQVVGTEPVFTRMIPVLASSALLGVAFAFADSKLKLTARARLLAGLMIVALLAAGAAVGISAYGSGNASLLSAVAEQWRSLGRDIRGQNPDSSELTADEDASSSRFLIPGSSGRWDIWRVGWLDFREHPLAGLGAGNYVFSYNQLRIRDRYSHEAHSLPLQALADTGIVGGLLLFGGLLLAFGRVIGERLIGWRGTLARISGRSPPGSASAPAPRPDHELAWIVSLLMAVGYWLLHSAVDWLWEMPAVTIPAFVFLALAVALSDSRGRSRARAAAQEAVPANGARPSSRASAAYRWIVAGLAAVTVVGLTLPYLSLKYEDMAAANKTADLSAAVGYARTASALGPAWSDPLLLAGRLYDAAARSSTDAGARLDNFALALDAAARAVHRDRANWIPLLQAAHAAAALAEQVALPASDGAAAPGGAPGSFAVNAGDQAAAARYRAMNPVELRLLGQEFGRAAESWNPKDQEVKAFLSQLSVAP